MFVARFAMFVISALLIAGCGGGGGGSGAPSSSTTGGMNTMNGAAAGLAACPAGNEIFSHAPIALEYIVGWEPLGAMNPPAHTFPTDHQYLYLRDPADSGGTIARSLFAPSNMRISLLYKMTYAATGKSDYSIFFQPCTDLLGRFGHVGSLSPELAAAAGPIDQRCTTYEPAPGSPVTLCESRPLSYDVAAGAQIGNVDAPSLDWWLYDRRIPALRFANQARFNAFGASGGFDEAHIVPASEYFVSVLASQVTSKLGLYNGSVKRTTAPRGGSIAVDVDGTARGYWFNSAFPWPPEDRHAALAPDHVQSETYQVFSIGLSQPSRSGPLYGIFTPIASGTINRAFETVSADGQIRCYELRPSRFDQNGPFIIVLLQLPTPTTLKLEVRHEADSCAALQPYAFGAQSFTYVR